MPSVDAISMRHYYKGSQLRRAGFSDWHDSLLQMILAAGGAHRLAVQNGNVYAWGGDAIGDGTTNDVLTPELIDPAELNDIVAVAAGAYSSYALSGDGSLWVWGDNTYGQLGLGTGTTEYLTPQHLLARPVTFSVQSGLLVMAIMLWPRWRRCRTGRRRRLR